MRPSQGERYFEKLLRSEIREVVGCTEPASIAYACARCMRLLRQKDRRVTPFDVFVELYLSLDVHRNASTVKVPVLRKKGILPAVACGLYGKDSSFNPFVSVKKIPARRLVGVLKKSGRCDINVLERSGLYVDVSVKSQKSVARVVIHDKHDNVVREYIDGRLIFKKMDAGGKMTDPGLSVSVIKRIVDNRPPRLLALARNFLLKQSELIKIGKSGFDIIGETSRLIKDRMEGGFSEVQTITGSGNQGIIISVPFYFLYRKYGERILPGFLFTMLAQIMMSYRKGRISSVCGLAEKSGPALTAGFSYLKSKKVKDIERDIALADEVLRGMLCEGAKPSCALKSEVVLGFLIRRFLDEKTE